MAAKKEAALNPIEAPGAITTSNTHPDHEPYLAVDHNRHTAIVLYKGLKDLKYVVMDSAGMAVVKASVSRFEADWKFVTNYDVKKAASKFLEAAKKFGSTTAVVKALAETVATGSIAPQTAFAVGAEVSDDGSVPQTKGEQDMAAKKKAAKKAKPAAKASRARLYADGQKLTPKATEYAPREGTKAHTHYTNATKAGTFAKYVEGGGDVAYLKYFVEKGAIGVPKS